jgi:hypothetical protein
MHRLGAISDAHGLATRPWPPPALACPKAALSPAKGAALGHPLAAARSTPTVLHCPRPRSPALAALQRSANGHLAEGALNSIASSSIHMQCSQTACYMRTSISNSPKTGVCNNTTFYTMAGTTPFAACLSSAERA